MAKRTDPQVIASRFEALMELQPHLLTTLTQLALKKKREGWVQYSIYALMNDLRSGYLGPDSCVKIDNNYAPTLARELMRREPRLEGFFRVRRSRRQTDFEDHAMGDDDWEAA